jgi:8-amino-7-oxononanoate synthase
VTRRDSSLGLSGALRAQLLERFAGHRVEAEPAPAVPPPRARLGDPQLRAELERMHAAAGILDIENPFFRPHEGIAGAETVIGGRRLLNLVSYNYLGLNGDRRLTAAALTAMERYGTSVSASRLVSGERPVHRELEAALAAVYEAEDCLTLVSGHATNVTTIAHLIGPGDAVVHDALAHNSIVLGAQSSGAQRLSFAHNDVGALDRLLGGLRGTARRVLVVIEGHYSMDGDIPDLPAIVAVTRRHGAWLMVDEAHSLGVLGAGGRGIAEHCGLAPGLVDIWMGTLSKTLCGCGGYIAGTRELVAYLRASVPGFVYSVGLSPPIAAAACTALAIMRAEPWRVAKVNANARLFLDLARAAGLNTGSAIGAAIVPVIVGSSIKAVRVADLLFRRGINAQPILHPAVPERAARLRFFLSSLHEPAQIRAAVAATADALAEVEAHKLDLAALALRLGAAG